MTKPILFVDFDGTLCHSKFWRSLDNEQSKRVQELVFKNNPTKANDWMTGECTAEEINRFVADELGIAYEEIWKVFVKDCQNMEVDTEALEILQSFRGEYRVVLITDNMDSLSRFTVPALNLGHYFDDIVNSFEAGKMKRDNEGELFANYASSHDVPLEECILIDDSESICELFQSLGGKVLRVTPEIGIIKHLSSRFD